MEVLGILTLLALFLIGCTVLLLCFVVLIARAARDRVAAAQSQAQQIARRGKAAEEFRIMTVTIPDGGGVYTWQPAGDPCRLEECPPGPFLFRGTLCVKSLQKQYGSTDLNGETLVEWEKTRDLVVQPVIVTDADPEPFWIEQ